MSVRYGPPPPPAPGTLLAVIPPTHGKAALMTELAARLHLPGYFGHNWDALADMLADLSWTKHASLVIAHEAVPELPAQDLHTYLALLAEPRRHLVTLFPASAESAVRKVLARG